MMKPIHILLVEDNEGDILLTTEALAERKITNKISIAKDGREALDFLSKKGGFEAAEIPDLILLDINLPKISGHEVLNRIKSHEAWKVIPVIILTTSSSDKDIFTAYQQHANCYISKPIDMDDFMEVITAIENFWISIVKLPNN